MTIVANHNPDLILLEISFIAGDAEDPGEINELPIVAWEVGTFPDWEMVAAKPVSLYSFTKEGAFEIVQAVFEKDTRRYQFIHEKDWDPKMTKRAERAVYDWMRK